MNSLSMIGFLAIVGIGSYMQAFTGFALGIFVLGAVVVLQLIPLEVAATAINIMTVVNTVVALRGRVEQVSKKKLALTLLGVVPGVPVGLWLLNVMSAQSMHILQVILGVLVLVAGAMLFAKPQPRDVASSSGSFVATGTVGGMLGGLFSVPGPPVIYHFYKQPMAMEQVRLTLISIFGAVSLVRLVFVGVSGTFSSEALYLGALSIPVVAAMTYLFVRFPPAISEHAVRRFAFLLLSAMGVGILLMA